MAVTVLQYSDYVPRKRHHYLDMRFVHRVGMGIDALEVAGDIEEQQATEILREAYHFLGRGPYLRMGDIIQMPEGELRERLSEGAFDIVQADLAKRQLRVGMRAPGWKPKPLPAHIAKLL